MKVGSIILIGVLISFVFVGCVNKNQEAVDPSDEELEDEFYFGVEELDNELNLSDLDDLNKDLEELGE